MSLVLYEKEFKEINECLNNLLLGAKAKSIFLVDKSGQLITNIGDTVSFDSIALASLTAGNFAATSALAQLMGQNEFSLLFHQGEKENIHISVVESRIILVVIFDDRTSLGLIRLRVKTAISVLSEIFKRLFVKVKKEKELIKSMSKKEESHPKPEMQTPSKPLEALSEKQDSTKDNSQGTQTEPEIQESNNKTSEQSDRFGEDFQQKAANKIDNLFMD
ncbi:roadblock/LC7 domain-containing protein [Candidatus Desantisbacteria bacterium]|nr:roadblock/LC7 domain-containing protein [Candidatus Desantisbacteria bacterium]